MKWQSSDSARIGMEPELISSYRSDDTRRSEEVSAVFALALFNIDLFKICGE